MNRDRISTRTKIKFRNSARDLINSLSRPVAVYSEPTKTECPNCFFDKTTNLSTGVCKWTAIEALNKQNEWIVAGNTTVMYKYFVRGRCPICKGVGFLTEDIITYVDCVINWNSTNDTTQTSAGREGSNIVKLKTEPANFELFITSTKLIIDGVTCKLARPPILNGIGGTHIMNLVAYTSSKLDPNSGEFIADYT